jgi:anti-sigma-K factor RskA
MTEQDDTLQALAAAYALGGLAPGEAREFEATLARSPEARAALAAYREVVALLPYAAGGPAPASSLRDKVIARATGQRSPRAVPIVRRAGRAVRFALAASVLLAVYLGTQLVRLAGDRDRLAADIAELRTQMAGQDSLLAQVFAPGVELYRLTGGAAGAPEVQLYWNRADQVALLHARHLPPLTAGRTYQLWLIPEGGAPVPSALFVPGSDGVVTVARVSVPALTTGRYAAFAVTEEPAGGSPAPTSTPSLVAALPS